MRIIGRVRLKDLRAISQKEFEKAVRICEVIKRTIELRSSYIKTHDIDSDIALPSGIWEKDFSDIAWWYQIYRYVLTPKYDTINNLRLYSQVFSGYVLMSMAYNNSAVLDSLKEKPIREIPSNFDEIIEELAPSPDMFVSGYIGITRYLPKWMTAKAPKCLGEIGWDVDGSPVNYDVYSYQERLNFLYETGIINWLRRKVEKGVVVNILEIGGGYGGLAYYIKRILPKANYFICDIPESLLFSTLYLGITRSDCQHIIYDGTDQSLLNRNDHRFKFIPNFLFDDLSAAKVKIALAINTLSFSEMLEKQVRYYAQRLQMLLGETGVLFEQNQDNRTIGGCYAKEILHDYFKFRDLVISKTVRRKFTSGEVAVWTNRQISDIIHPSLKPFKGTIVGMYLQIRAFLTIERLKWFIRKLIGSRFYSILKCWWNSLNDKRNSLSR